MDASDWSIFLNGFLTIIISVSMIFGIINLINLHKSRKNLDSIRQTWVAVPTYITLPPPKPVDIPDNWQKLIREKQARERKPSVYVEQPDTRFFDFAD